MIFLSKQNVNQNGVKIQLQETLFGNGINFQKLSERKNQRKILKKNYWKRCKKDTNEFQWTKKLKALKVYFYKIIHEN